MIELPKGLMDLAISGVSIVVVIYGVIEALKQAGFLKPNLAPLVALGIGAATSIAYALAPGATDVVIRGVAAGVGASLAYAGFKKAASNASNAARNGEGM